MWYEQGFVLVFGEGDSHAGTRRAWLRRAVPPECRGLLPGIGKLGSQRWYCNAYYKWLWTYAEGRGREIGPATFLVPSSPLWILSLRDMLQEVQKYFPTVWVRCSSECCFHSICLWVVFCLFSRSSAVPSGFSGPGPLTFNTPNQSTGWKNSQNWVLLVFQANDFGEMFSLWVPMCSSLCLVLL